MKISIITVTYNRASTISDTIESILNQSYSNIEYIVVDGASTDNTKEILIHYEPLFEGKMIWISEPDSGIYDAMNKGISLASGDVIGILNSDDCYCSANILEIINHSFETNDCDAVFADLEFINEKKQIIRTYKGSPYYTNAFIYGWYPAHPTFFVKRKIYEKYGKFDTSFEISADFELMLRFIEKNHILTSYIPETIIRMRYGGASTGSLRNIYKGNRNVIRAFKKNNIAINPIYYILKRLWNKRMQLNWLFSKKKY